MRLVRADQELKPGASGSIEVSFAPRQFYAAKGDLRKDLRLTVEGQEGELVLKCRANVKRWLPAMVKVSVSRLPEIVPPVAEIELDHAALNGRVLEKVESEKPGVTATILPQESKQSTRVRFRWDGSLAADQFDSRRVICTFRRLKDGRLDKIPVLVHATGLSVFQVRGSTLFRIPATAKDDEVLEFSVDLVASDDCLPFQVTSVTSDNFAIRWATVQRGLSYRVTVRVRAGKAREMAGTRKFARTSLEIRSHDPIATRITKRLTLRVR
ncbi:MAG: hypothetical protein AAF517_17595 [Planctomycetota bacterium]